MSGLDALPPVADAALPRAVREGSGADRRAYRAALGFESVLMGELVEEMTKASPSLTEGPRADAITDAMTAALAAAGGIGLAPGLYAAMRKDAS